MVPLTIFCQHRVDGRPPTVVLGAYGKDRFIGYFIILHVGKRRYRYYMDFQVLEKAIALCKFSGLKALNYVKKNCMDYERLADNPLTFGEAGQCLE